MSLAKKTRPLLTGRGVAGPAKPTVVSNILIRTTTRIDSHPTSRLQTLRAMKFPARAPPATSSSVAPHKRQTARRQPTAERLELSPRQQLRPSQGAQPLQHTTRIRNSGWLPSQFSYPSPASGCPCELEPVAYRTPGHDRPAGCSHGKLLSQ